MNTIADQLMTASPCLTAWRSEPFSVSEIDTHPDAGRIWATIEALKSKTLKSDDEASVADENARDEVVEDVNFRIERFIDKHEADLSDAWQEELRDLTGGLA